MKKILKKRSKTGIKDINEIKRQYRAGISINYLSQYWDIPYATLYRAIKGNKNEKDKIKL